MTEDCIKVWKFDDAPIELKSECGGPETPKWLALVPFSLRGKDLEDAIQVHSEPGTLVRYQTESGDLIYAGSARVDLFMQAVASSSETRREQR